MYQGDCKSEDLISKLPNDILVIILSRLPLKEAVASSILASRWRYLSTYLTRLIFEADASLDKVATQPNLLNSERSKYINRVNRVTTKHKGDTLDTFSIAFDLDKSSKNAIDNWVKFAIEKNVQNLELDLRSKREYLGCSSRSYSFPYKLLTQAKRSSSSKRLCPNVPSVKPCTLVGLKSLKELTLKSVNICDEALENMLLHCPLLESLSLRGSGGLVNVTINGPSIRLRSLKIVACFGLETIKICDTNLVELTYFGEEVTLHMENVPKLVDISMGEASSSPGLDNNVFRQISCCLNQLKFLTLDMLHPQVSKSL